VAPSARRKFPQSLWTSLLISLRCRAKPLLQFGLYALHTS
jgi:hypothetical protein